MHSLRTNRTSPRVDVSPSVSLERGGYRMRAPRFTGPIPTLDYGQDAVVPGSVPRQSSKKTGLDASSLNRHLTVLLACLGLACVSCFAFAYYLFASRWELILWKETTTPTDRTQANARRGHSTSFILSANNRYLTYLPHSGLNNQRISLENALTLAHLLNRTLLIPPIRFGAKPIRYQPFDTLDNNIVLSGVDGLEHCGTIPPWLSLPLECMDYFDRTMVSWTTLFDMSQIESRQSVIYLPSLATNHIAAALSSLPNGVIQVRDEAPYQYHFVDTGSRPAPHKYAETVSIQELKSLRDIPLLQLGTLFGTSRLSLGSDGATWLSDIRAKMVLKHSTLDLVASQITRLLPYPYVGLHLRVGDGIFQEHRDEIVQESMCLLLQRMGYSSPGIVELLRSHDILPHLYNTSTTCLQALDTTLQLRLPSRPSRPSASSHTLSYTLFISTDLQNPQKHPSLLPLRQVFPRMTFLSDFRAQLEPFKHFRNEDGVELFPYLLPLVEAIVVAKGKWVVGTKGSTFSKFIEHTLWPAFHPDT